MKKKIFLCVFISLLFAFTLCAGCADYSSKLEYEEVIVDNEVIGYSISRIDIKRDKDLYTKNDTVKKLTIPSTYNDKPVIQIGFAALQGLIALKKIEIPDSIVTISRCAFTFCYALQQVTLTNGVQSIGISAFSDCNALRDVYFKGTEDEWKLIEIGNGNDCLLKAEIHYIL